MTIDNFTTLYDYNYWANARIVHAAEQLSDVQLIAPTQESHSSLRGTLVHTTGADWDEYLPPCTLVKGEERWNILPLM
jgi:uncharacterized damage-inducible protein DinB